MEYKQGNEENNDRMRNGNTVLNTNIARYQLDDCIV